MNNITLAHIGGDLVLIGGVAFYFHRKTNLLQEQFTALKKENKKLKEDVQELMMHVQQLGAMVMQPRQTPAQQTPAQQTPQPATMLPAMMSSVNDPRRPPRTRSRPKKPVPENSDSEGEPLDERELDKELATEYQQLLKERNCDGDVCELGE